MRASRLTSAKAVAVVAGIVLAVLPLPPASATNPTDGHQPAPLVGMDRSGVVPDAYLVVLDRSAADRTEEVAAVATSAGGSVGTAFTSAIRGFVATLPSDALDAVRAVEGVRYVEADYSLKLDLPTPTELAADDVQPDATWGLDRIDQRDLPLDTTYRYNLTGDGVRAYIIDTGIRITHGDFEGRASYGYDTVDDNTTAEDCHGHGTHVAGTVGSTTYGVAKDVELIAVRVIDCDGGVSYSDIVQGVDWVTENAIKPAVVNMSLGIPVGFGLEDAVKESIKQGFHYAVAVGGGSDDRCETFTPAGVRRAVTTSASDHHDAEASFSSFGPCVDVFAPGVNITSLGIASDTATTQGSGTSMASAHAAGVIALLLEKYPDKAPAKIARKLRQQSSKDKLTGVDPTTKNNLLYSRVR